MKKLLVVLLLLYPLSASALTYEWTDDRGTVNFTEDLGKVPKKYRKRAKVLGADETSAPQVIENSESAKGKPKDIGSQRDNTTLSVKEETALRNEYHAAKADLKAVEQENIELRTRLGDTSKMSRTEYLSLQNTLKQNDFRIKEQKKKLEQLRENAGKVGVHLDQK